VITDKSPFIVRTSQTAPQIAAAFGTYEAQQNVKKVVTLVADYGPGIDMETWFSKTFTAGGGTIVANLRVPLANPDFAPFLQRVRDEKPDAVFVFTPSGMGAIFIKQFVERGLDKTGIKLIATGDVTDDDQLQDMGDVTLGVVTAGPYSASHVSTANVNFVTAFRENNNNMRPNFMAVFGYDGMRVIYDAIKKTNGKAEGEALVEAMKGDQFESPRGPLMIDPATREPVQTVYIRKVAKVNGQLYNEEFSGIKDVHDPAKTAAP
jgi:branched-chain amino acid transport system substrate-binding protein